MYACVSLQRVLTIWNMIVAGWSGLLSTLSWQPTERPQAPRRMGVSGSALFSTVTLSAVKHIMRTMGPRRSPSPVGIPCSGREVSSVCLDIDRTTRTTRSGVLERCAEYGALAAEAIQPRLKRTRGAWGGGAARPARQLLVPYELLRLATSENSTDLVIGHGRE